MEPGKSVKPAPGMMGPGGASTSPINLGGGLDAPKNVQSIKPGIGAPVTPPSAKDSLGGTQSAEDTLDEGKAKEIAEEAERRQLESLLQDLREAIDKSQALEPFKDQLLLDITPEGLRIQIVDKQNRPMFDLGGSRLKPYTEQILGELAKYLNTVPNHISLTGHTDAKPYPGGSGRTNWDLSADRANAARRALEAAGLNTDKIARVVGLSSSVLFDKANPLNPINRRISLIVMTREAAEKATRTEEAQAGTAETQTAAPSAATAAPPAAPAQMPGPNASSPPAGKPSVQELAQAVQAAADAKR
jgi:chemotaxis protein MotB